MDALGRKSLWGMASTAFGKVAGRGVQFLLGLALARLLTPEDFGFVGMLGIFIGISNVFIDCGFAAALIRKQQRRERDYATVFWFSLAVSLAAYAALFVAAPFIGRFFHRPELEPIARVVLTGLVFGALSAVPQARLRIELKFGTLSALSVTAITVSGLAGLWFAVCGFGAWSLVWQGVIWRVVHLALVEAAARYWPRGGFSRESFREFFAFGWKHLAANLIDQAWSNVHALVLGRTYAAATVGLYARADAWARLPAQVTSDALCTVNYPLLSKLQRDNAALRAAFGRLTLLALGVMTPAMALLMAFARPLVGFVLGPQWVSCAPYVAILACGYLVEPLVYLWMTAFYVKGRTDWVLSLEFVLKPIAFGLLFAALPFGLKWVCLARSAFVFVAAAVAMAAAWRLLR